MTCAYVTVVKARCQPIAQANALDIVESIDGVSENAAAIKFRWCCPRKVQIERLDVHPVLNPVYSLVHPSRSGTDTPAALSSAFICSLVRNVLYCSPLC